MALPLTERSCSMETTEVEALRGFASRVVSTSAASFGSFCIAADFLHLIAAVSCCLAMQLISSPNAKEFSERLLLKEGEEAKELTHLKKPGEARSRPVSTPTFCKYVANTTLWLDTA